MLGLALLGDSGFFSALIGVGDEGEFIGGAGAGAAVELGRLGLGGAETLGLNGDGGAPAGDGGTAAPGIGDGVGFRLGGGAGTAGARGGFVVDGEREGTEGAAGGVIAGVGPPVAGDGDTG